VEATLVSRLISKLVVIDEEMIDSILAVGVRGKIQHLRLKVNRKLR